MAKNFVVTFSNAGARIHSGVDLADWEGKQCLVNPKLPPGITPHLWVFDPTTRAIASISQEEYDRRNPIPHQPKEATVTSKDSLNALEEGAKQLVIPRYERRLRRLQGRWLLFPGWRAEWLLWKIRALRG